MIGRPERLMPGHLVGATISTMRSYSFLSPVFTIAAFQYISIPMASADQAVAQAPAEISASDSLENAIPQAEKKVEEAKARKLTKAPFHPEQSIPFISLDAHRHFEHAEDEPYVQGHSKVRLNPKALITFDWIKKDMELAYIEKAFLLSDAYLIDNGNGVMPETRLKEREQRFYLNRELSEFITAHPESFFGFCGINIVWDDRDKVLEECLKLPHMVGVKLHFLLHRQKLNSSENASRFESLLKVARSYHSIFLMHMHWAQDPTGEIKALFALAKKYPELTFIIAHAAGKYGDGTPLILNIAAQELADVSSSDNVYTEVSTWSDYNSPPELVVKSLRAFGIRHVLFGTDSPYMNSSGELEEFMKLPLTNEERRLILYQNGLDFLEKKVKH